MAAKGSFGAYSSVPTTTGMGQGSAQVFTPQAIQLDTTAIQRGAQAIGQGIAKADADKKAAEAAKAKAKAEADAKLNERKAGQYNYNEAAMNMATDEIQKKYINGEIDFAEYNEQINRFTKNTEGIRQFETGVLQPEQQKFVTDENARSYGEDGGWDTYANRTDYLSGDLDETAIELIKEDPTLGKFNAYQQSKYRDVQKNFGKYDPDFSLAGAAFSDASWSDFKNSQDKVTRAAIEDAERQGYDKKTIVSTTIGSDKFKEHLKQRPDIMGKWVQQQKFNENLSPEYIQKLFSEDMSPLVTEAYGEEIEKLILPSTGKETEIDFVKAPTDGDGKDKEFNVTKTVLGKGDAERLAALKADEYDQMFSDLGSNLDSDEDQKAETARLKDRFVVGLQAAIEKDANLTSIQITKKGEELKPITIGSSKGTLQEVYINPEGKGFLIINEEKTVSSRTKDGTDGETTSEKVIEPKVIELNDRLIGKIEAMYGVDLLPEKKYIASNGYAYTKQQLIDANYTEEYIKSLKTQ